MKKKIIPIIAIILLIAGIGLLLFPVISNFIGSKISKAQTELFEERTEHIIPDMTYEEAVEKGVISEDGRIIGDEKKADGKKDNKTSYKTGTPVLFQPDLDRLFKDVVAYNKRIREDQSTLLINEDAYAKSVIDLRSYGITDEIFGYLIIPAIDMWLPVYLGAGAQNMSYGAAHMTYTTLPLGEARSNCVIAGHTEYIGRIFFDNLRNLGEGDEVTFRNYWTNLHYKVVKTEVCTPEQSQDIYISDDRDLLTLFTCIPNGSGGFNRFFVICERDR